MKVGIMQPYFFPYIGYWQLINMVDVFVIYDMGKYRPCGWINRNRIKINGESAYITIPVHRSTDVLIKEEKIVEDFFSRRKIIRTLEVNYRKAPFFNPCMEAISDSILFETESLSHYLYHNMVSVNQYLRIETPMVKSSELPILYREGAVNRILDICNYYSADYYVNPIGGQSLYNKEDFLKEAIQIDFLKPKDIFYQQGKGQFISNLSIIEVMMYNSRDDIKQMLGEYVLL